jgi:nucleoside-diphosphate-sugar epimerase
VNELRVLVTGGTGFTGSYLAKRLVERGHEVRVLARKATEKTDYLQGLGVEISFGDITKKKSVDEVVKNVKLVYHLSAAGFRRVGVPNQVYRDVNVNGTKNILDASLKENVDRFVHCSTIGVLGHIPNPPADESHPYNPGDLYQETKCEGEKLALKYFQEKKLPGVVVRPCGIYGPGDTRLLRLFKAIYHQNFFMVGKGNVSYHLVYIDDLIDGFELCGERKEALGQIYIIGGNEAPSLNRLVAVVAKALNVPLPKRRFPFVWPIWLIAWIIEVVYTPFGAEPPLFRRRVDLFRKNRAFNISKAKNELGYKPKVDLETGIKTTAEWYTKKGWL